MTLYRDRADHQHRVDVSDYGEHVVIYCAQGGGFQLQMARANFDILFEPETTPPPFVRCTVTAEFLGYDPEIALPCYSNGDCWNGWGMPYFPREIVDRLIALTEAGGLLPLRWDSATGVQVIVKDDDIEDGEYALDPVTMPDGVLAWPIGAGSWCWDSCEPVKETT